MTAGVHRLPFKWLRVAVLEHLNSLISRNILIAFKFGGEEKHNKKKKNLEGKTFIEHPYMFLLM